MHNNHENHHEHHHHITSNKFKLIVTIFINVIITISEYIGGILSGSLALISDAGHNLSDVLSLMLGYAGEKVSEKSPDKKYSFGLKRFEVLIALINALSLIAIGIFIVNEAISRFINPVQININIMIPVAIIGLLGNLFSILILFKNKNTNINMKAAFLHLLYDTISSIAVIAASIFLYFTHILLIDLIISLLIVIMMVWSSIGIIKESIIIFLQGTPLHINTDDVYKSINEIMHVGSVHGLHIWSISSTEIFLSCHICINKNNTEINSDNIIRNINSMLEEKYGITHTTLQIENDQICSINSNSCCR